MRILIADDDRMSRVMLRDRLKKWEHEVICAADGAEAWQLLDTEDAPRLVILDWMMPEMDGLEVCRRIRLRKEPYIYVILLTGKTDRQDIVEGMGAGADDYIAKPFDAAELNVRVRAGERLLNLHEELLDAREALEHQATHDALTGLPNRRHFMEQFEREWERSNRYEFPLSCVMLDVDFFKRINDAYGHATGDEALKLIAGVFERACRSSDFYCRLGGEEFCVLLPQTNEEQAALWAERVRASVAQTTLSAGEESLQLSASFGVAERLDDMPTPDVLLDLADQALLAAKQSGRNRVVQFACLSASGSLAGAQSGNDSPLTGRLARDVMVRPVACLNRELTVAAAADFFLQNRLNSAPVVDASGKLVGIVSEKDLLAKATDEDFWNSLVGDYANESVVCFDEDVPAQTIYDFLNRVSIRRVIIRKDGQPTGVIGRGTLLRWLNNRASARRAGGREDALHDETVADEARTNLLESAEALRQSVEELRRRIADDDQPAPAIVGEVTRIQELTTDVLAGCRQHADGRGAGHDAGAASF